MTTQLKGMGAVTGSELVSVDRLQTGFESHGYYQRYFKRALDVAFVLLSAPIAVPLIVVFAVIAASDGAWPFFSQRRVGKDGKVYKMYKIRTMVKNAREELDKYLSTNPAAKREWMISQKLKVDPRITGFGKFLRKSSMDELPQLWNVLVGDMSVVGPRPIMEEQVPIYPGSAYYRLRPGITGPWQVTERNETTFDKRATFDTDYLNTLSFMNDVRLIGRTVFVVVRCNGY